MTNTIDKPDTLPEVMTVSEIAALLKVHPVTVRLNAAAGKIPGRQIGNRWRFSRLAITAWLEKK
jgi:excisionase family DNA binding protein